MSAPTSSRATRASCLSTGVPLSGYTSIPQIDSAIQSLQTEKLSITSDPLQPHLRKYQARLQAIQSDLALLSSRRTELERTDPGHLRGLELRERHRAFAAPPTPSQPTAQDFLTAATQELKLGRFDKQNQPSKTAEELLDATKQELRRGRRFAKSQPPSASGDDWELV